MKYYIIAFRSRNDAMKVRDELLRNGVGCIIIETPRNISSACGLSLKMDLISKENLLRIISGLSSQTLISGVYEVSQQSNSKSYARIF